MLEVSERSALGPPIHPDLAHQQSSNLASAYQAAGRTAESTALLKRLLPAFERTFGPDHPNTLVSHNKLALANFYDGRLVEAIALYEKTLKVSEKISGPIHPETFVINSPRCSLPFLAGRTVEA